MEPHRQSPCLHAEVLWRFCTQAWYLHTLRRNPPKHTSHAQGFGGLSSSHSSAAIGVGLCVGGETVYLRHHYIPQKLRRTNTFLAKQAFLFAWRKLGQKLGATVDRSEGDGPAEKDLDLPAGRQGGTSIKARSDQGKWDRLYGFIENGGTMLCYLNYSPTVLNTIPTPFRQWSTHTDQLSNLALPQTDLPSSKRLQIP
jgi:hypothetical protein